ESEEDVRAVTEESMKESDLAKRLKRPRSAHVSTGYSPPHKTRKHKRRSIPSSLSSSRESPREDPESIKYKMKYLQYLQGFLTDLKKQIVGDAKRHKHGFKNFIHNNKVEKAKREKFEKEQERLYQSLKARREMEQEREMRKLYKQVKYFEKQRKINEHARMKQFEKEALEYQKRKFEQLDNL